MKYILKNISQSTLPKTITLFVLGSSIWIPSLIRDEKTIVLITMILTIVNSFLAARLFYKGGETNIPSWFVSSTFWFIMSAIPTLHTSWQAQIITLGVLLTNLVLHKINYQHEATEEAFLATMICCFLAPIKSVMYTGMIMILGYLIIKGQMTWRVLVASLFAVAIRILLMGILHYFEWLEWLWIENIPQLSTREWITFAGVGFTTALSTLLPLRKPSLVSSIIYMVCLLGVATYGIILTIL